ncbi:SMC-Scp complex subunit ScpB [Candidatus Pacearchaeota archaeon]|nr:SMC-Scp complex subunit ScpB [Candidatus Pacearchaeota archaeon]
MHLNKESIDEIDREIEEENMRKVEAALFISGKFMSIQELVALTDVNPILLKKIVEDLSEKYKDAGVEIVNKNNLWKMDVSSEYVWMVNKLAGGNSEFTKAEQETLALVAYKQPIKQSVVVKIRGNKAYEHIKNFVLRGLVNKKKMGHTSELSLNESFFDYFSQTGNNGEINNFEMIGGFDSVNKQGVKQEATTKDSPEVKEQNNGAEQAKTGS